jgi:hypothetical protein
MKIYVLEAMAQESFMTTSNSSVCVASKKSKVVPVLNQLSTMP